MIQLWLTGAEQGITGLLGTPEQQRAMAEKARAEEERRREFDILRMIQREQLAEQRRQADLPDQPIDVSGEINAIRVARGLEPLPSPVTVRRGSASGLTSALAAEPKYQTVDELETLGVFQPPLLIRQAMGQAPGETGLPEMSDVIPAETRIDVRDIAAERARGRIKVHPEIAREIGQRWKTADTERRENTQRMSTAAYRQTYDQLIAGGIPHSLANATAIDSATKKYGIAPEHQAFVPTPTERAGPKMGLEDEYLQIKKAKPAGPYSPYEDLVVKQYEEQKAKRERGTTVVDLALEEAARTGENALDILQRNMQRSQEAVERRATFIIERAQSLESASRGIAERYTMTQEQYAARLRPILQQLIQGESQAVQELVAQKMGLDTPTPTGGEQLSRRDPRYKRLQDRKLTDQQIETQFGVKLVP